MFHFVPPKPIRQFKYYCDKKFRIDLIEDLYEKHEDYGILYLNGCEFTFYCLNGYDLYEVTKTTRKKLPRTHRRGGQSQNRFARLHDEAIHNYLVKINEACLDVFINEDTSLPNIKGMVIIGSGNKKMQFQTVLDSRLKTIVLGVFTSERLDYQVALEVIQKFTREKNISLVKEVFDCGGKLSYGEKEVIENVENGLMEMIILTPQLEKSLIDKGINDKYLGWRHYST